MKRKNIIICICTIAFLVLCGCGSKAEVPEQTIDWVIQDHVKNETYDYSVSIKHSPDRKAHTDSVDIEMTLCDEYYTLIDKYTAVYQYDKSSDLWEKIRGGRWTGKKLLRVKMSESPEEWAQALEKAGVITTNPYSDREEETLGAIGINIGDALVKSTINFWHLEGEYESRIWGVTKVYNWEILTCIMDSEKNAMELFTLGTDQFNFDAVRAAIRLQAGENFVISTDMDKAICCSDNKVFIIWTNGNCGSIASYLKYIGFPYDYLEG